MVNKQVTKEANNISNVVYHNLQLARHSINELNYLLNNPLDSVLFGALLYPPNCFINLIDIHGRNATIMLCSMFEGDLSLIKMINYFQTNIDSIDFKNPAVNKAIVASMIKDSVSEMNMLKDKYYQLIKANRDKIAAHQDKINTNKPSDLHDFIFPLSNMNDLLPQLEKIFAKLYYSLTNVEYVIYKERSFINEGLHSLFDNNMKELDK